MKLFNNMRDWPGSGRWVREWLWLAGLLLVPALGLATETPEQVRAQLYSFSLTVNDYRQEEKAAFVDSDPLSIEFESELKLHGGICETAVENKFVFTIYNDSLLYRSLQPLRFNTFMSGDTIHYASQEGPNFIDRSYSEAHDSMLACLFSGPAMKIERRTADPGLEITLLKKDCRSGEYTRLDPAGAFGLFFVDVRPADLEKGHRWQEYKPCPGYSGLGFRPLLRLAGRVVMVNDGEATVVLSSDTTCSDVQIKLPNGENATILSETIRVGGTLVLNIRTGCPIRGEVWIEESVQFLRPRLSDRVLEKKGSYILRWRRY